LTPDRRTILALFSLTFGIRILYAVLAGTDPDIILNPITYDFMIGRSIADGTNWWSQPISPRAPGYQLTLGALFAVGGVHRWLVIVMQAFFSGVIAFVIYRIGEKTLGTSVGLAAAIWFAVYVHQAHYSSIVARDVTVGMLVALICYLLIRYSHSMRGALWTALVYSLLVHVDPQYLLFLPVVVLFYLSSIGRHGLLRVQYTFLFLGTVVLLLAPWTIRNYRVYGDPIPVALEATKYLPPAGTAPAGPVGVSETEGKTLSRPGFWRNSVEYWRVMSLVERPQKTADGVSRVLPPWSARHNLISLGTYGLLLPFFLLGVWFSAKSRNLPGLVLAIAVAGMYLVRAFYGGSPRARVPAEPLIILLSFYAVVELYKRYRSPRSGVAEEGGEIAAEPDPGGD
jgi:4-amino-4-deoxy-L-arabinose transferase-like glycosyltransferase